MLLPALPPDLCCNRIVRMTNLPSPTVQFLAPFASLLGFIAVAFGAFGSHGLAERFTDKTEGWWQTATLYLLVHAAAALAVGISGKGGLVRAGGWCLALGASVFAGTLYAMALGAPSLFGAVTPMGGLLLLIGWMLIGWGTWRQ